MTTALQTWYYVDQLTQLLPLVEQHHTCGTASHFGNSITLQEQHFTLRTASLFEDSITL